MQVVESIQVEQSSTKTKLINIFKNCLNILRDNEGLTGEKALRNLSYLFILKLIEPHLGNEIDIDNYEFNLSDYNEGIAETTKEDLLYLSRFSNLAEESEDNLLHNIKCLWEIILSSHPSTKKIFLKGRGFDIKYSHTFRVLLTKLKSIDLSSAELDILGSAYEEVIKDVMTGKVLGQFFTQPSVKRLMVDIVNPQIHADGKIETCGDPTMGTGGFLITYLSYILKQARERGVTPDWEFIKTEGLYGKELEPDTFQLAVSNMLISSGHLFDQLDCGDSIRVPITRKFDNILANPPFGIKGLKYDSFSFPMKNEYVPIKSDNAVTLFIQVIINMLKINGKCAVVLPDGQDLFNKSNVTLIAVREYLMKTCDLQEVIYLSSGIFENTGIKTCIFYFIKKKEGNEVLEADIKVSRNNKEIGREYIFSEEHQTRLVKFFSSDVINQGKDNERIEKKLIIEVPIEIIKNNKYSLKYSDYISNKSSQIQYSNNINIKKLGEICSDISTSHSIASSNRVDGEYRFFTCSREETTHNEFHYEGTYIIHGSRGSTIKDSLFFTNNEKFAIGTSMFISEVKNKSEILPKYLYYYFKLNNIIFDKYINGSAIPMINKANYYEIDIPVPSFQIQKDLVEYLDFIYETAVRNSNERIDGLKKKIEFKLKMQKLFGKNTWKTIGSVCDFKNGKGIKKESLLEGDYPVIGGGQQPLGFHNQFNTNENVILCSSSGAYSGFISRYEKKVWKSDCFSIIPKNNEINNDFLFYYLKFIQRDLYALQSGSSQPHVYSRDLENINIPIPLYEVQESIVRYCDLYTNYIKQLEQEIEQDKKDAKMHLESVLQK